MKSFLGKTAVVNGAASGIGRAIAERCVREGMKVVVSDIERDALARTVDILNDRGQKGAQVLGVVADVSQSADVEALAAETMGAFGGVHLLFNNAGVAGGAGVWESSFKDWQWIIGVNLWGVIHGLHTFVPLMLEHNESAHIVNTSSISGLTTFHPDAPYHMTKHGIVALSELLYHDLAMRSAKIGVSVLCPGPVRTGIITAARNRPAELQNEHPAPPQTDSPSETEDDFFRRMIEEGMPPERTADLVFEAIAENRFYILTHPELKPLVELRLANIVNGRNPILPPGP